MIWKYIISNSRNKVNSDWEEEQRKSKVGILSGIGLGVESRFGCSKCSHIGCISSKSQDISCSFEREAQGRMTLGIIWHRFHSQSDVFHIHTLNTSSGSRTSRMMPSTRCIYDKLHRPQHLFDPGYNKGDKYHGQNLPYHCRCICYH